MKQSLSQKAGNRDRRATLVLIAMGCGFLAAALLIGVNDNPPGLALVYLAVAAWILAFARRWRRVRSFVILLGVGLVGFLLSVILHNLLYALSELAADMVVLSRVLGFLGVVFFIFGVLVCPPGVLIGAVGSVVMAVRDRRRKRRSDDMPADR